MSLLLDIWEASGIWGKKLSRQIDANFGYLTEDIIKEIIRKK